jgi:hypothetical protein
LLASLPQFCEIHGFPGAEFHAAIAHQVRTRDTLGHAGRMVGRELYDAVTETKPLGRWLAAARNTSGEGEWGYSSRKWCSTSQA